jgi:ethanolamine utilization microcompartment shell protein EutS
MKPNYWTLLANLGIAALLCNPSPALAQTLGTATGFAVLGGSTVTNTGSTVVTGDLGVSPGTAITGFPPGFVIGTIHAADAVALQAQSDVTTAYNALAGLACNTNLTGQDLGGLTLTPGVYCFSSSAQLTGTLTLNAQGNSAAVFVFQIGSTLTTASNSSVLMTNGGSSCNVFWQVGSSATLGTDTIFFSGNILALTSITLNTRARISGRALARNGAVTMDTNIVSNAACSLGLSPTPTNTPTGTLTPPTNTPTNTPAGVATSTPTSTTTTGAVVPTLNESGMLIFGVLIAAAGLLLLIRRR